MEDYFLQTEKETLAEEPKKKAFRFGFLHGMFAVFLLAILAGYLFIFLPPDSFEDDTVYFIGTGSSLRSVSRGLKENNIIRSRAMFEALVILYGGERRIVPGGYLFEDRVSVDEVARRIATADKRLEPYRITIPEGLGVEEVAGLLTDRLPYFDRSEFLTRARGLEGYLFPDTYFFLQEATAEDAVRILNDNFEKKIAPLRSDIATSGRSEADIIIMASIIEREASGNADRETISGILWRRLAINMPLQVDAWPETYQHRGLPDRPIANPGLAAIRAALYPTETSYLYYLHDKNGNIHYARNYDDHLRNINRYLRGR